MQRGNNHGNGGEASQVSGFSALSVRILGPGSVARNGLPVALPRSRKVRALLAFLTLEPGPVSRSRLCDLLWDVPNDPRGELRWCLSKLRSVLDDPDRRRVLGTGQSLVSLDLSDCRVDALEVERLLTAGLGAGQRRGAQRALSAVRRRSAGRHAARRESRARRLAHRTAPTLSKHARRRAQ